MGESRRENKMVAAVAMHSRHSRATVSDSNLFLMIALCAVIRCAQLIRTPVCSERRWEEKESESGKCMQLVAVGRRGLELETGYCFAPDCFIIAAFVGLGCCSDRSRSHRTGSVLF